MKGFSPEGLPFFWAWKTAVRYIRDRDDKSEAKVMLAVYLAICELISDQNSRNGKIRCSRLALCKRTCLSKETVVIGARGLVRDGLIIEKRRTDSYGRRLVNEIQVVMNHPGWKGSKKTTLSRSPKVEKPTLARVEKQEIGNFGPLEESFINSYLEEFRFPIEKRKRASSLLMAEKSLSEQIKLWSILREAVSNDKCELVLKFWEEELNAEK